MLIFHQIYKKFLIQYVLFSLNLYQNLQTPHKNITFKYLKCPLIMPHVKALIKGPIMGIIKAP